MNDVRAEIVIRDGRDFFTDERMDVARLTYTDGAYRYVMLASRTDGDWFPTWVGLEDEASFRLPEGMTLPQEFLDALKRCDLAAVLVSEDSALD